MSADITKCPKCGASVELLDKFCPNCGADLTKLEVPKPVKSPEDQDLGKELVSDEKKCPKCGAAIIAGEQFCGECGAKIVLPDKNILTPSRAVVENEPSRTYVQTASKLDTRAKLSVKKILFIVVPLLILIVIINIPLIDGTRMVLVEKREVLKDIQNYAIDAGYVCASSSNLLFGDSIMFAASSSDKLTMYIMTTSQYNDFMSGNDFYFEKKLSDTTLGVVTYNVLKSGSYVCVAGYYYTVDNMFYPSGVGGSRRAITVSSFIITRNWEETEVQGVKVSILQKITGSY